MQTQDSILSQVEDPGPWSVTSSPKLQSVFFFLILGQWSVIIPQILELLLFGLEWGGVDHPSTVRELLPGLINSG